MWYPDNWISGYLDIQAILAIHYPDTKKVEISKYPNIQLSKVSKYPCIQVSMDIIFLAIITKKIATFW